MVRVFKGLHLEGYRFVSSLGTGATSQVWKVVKNDVAYAAKVFNMADEYYYKREIAMMRDSTGVGGSKGLIGYRDTIYSEQTMSRGKIKKTMVIIYELCGCQLSKYVREWRRKCDQATWITVAKHLSRCLLDATSDVHGKNYIHCDIKPCNILLVCSLACEPSKLLNIKHPLRLNDFGSAIEVGSVASLYGTSGYMSPESVVDIKCGVSADIWSVANTLWYLFIGSDFFDIDCKISEIYGCEDLLICNEEREGIFYENYKYLALVYKLLGPIPKSLMGGIWSRYYNIHGKPVDDAHAHIVGLDEYMKFYCDLDDDACAQMLFDLMQGVIKYEPSERFGLDDLRKKIG